MNATEPKATKRASLLNRAAVKRAALHYAESRGFTRVSAEFLDRIEIKLRGLIRAEVHAHPSVGKTLK